jgi:hypothetical protein
VIFGKLSKIKFTKTFRTKIPIASAEITDNSGKIKLVWFSQPYIAKMFTEGNIVRIEGKVSQRKPKNNDIPELYFSNPKIEKVLKDIDAKEKAKEVSEDEKFRLKSDLQKMIDDSNKELDGIFEKKEKEIGE